MQHDTVQTPQDAHDEQDEQAPVEDVEQEAHPPVFPWRFVTPAPDPRVKRPRNRRQAPQ